MDRQTFITKWFLQLSPEIKGTHTEKYLKEEMEKDLAHLEMTFENQEILSLTDENDDLEEEVVRLSRDNKELIEEIEKLRKELYG